MNEQQANPVLVTGATGYIGGRLAPRLLERGLPVRVLVRNAARIQGRSWAGQVEIVEGDIRDPVAVRKAVTGVRAVYYLIHSMGGRGAFERLDREAAETYASLAGMVPLTVYLGGLEPRGGAASAHLRSRLEVGGILRARVPTTEFRAGPIIGSGSASFEMIRYLTERLPAMIAPKWILNDVQPIGVRDMIEYLLAALDVEPAGVVEVGGEVLTFKEMMLQYAEIRGIRRVAVPVPVLAPGLAARWVGLVTPIPNRLAVPLVRGVVSPLYADTEKAKALFPLVRPSSYRDCVQRALRRMEEGRVETRWSGALGEAEAPSYALTDWEGLIRETRTMDVNASPECVYRVVSSLGGDRGWLVWNWAWRMRGGLDRLCGGPGLRRGRRDPHDLLPGEAVDFWRVEAVEPNRDLLLRAEMKVPGRAWLRYEMRPREGGSRLVQTAIFAPRGFWGPVYWKALYPIHRWIFSDMANAIRRQAEKNAQHAVMV